MASSLDFESFARCTMSARVFEALQDGAANQVTLARNHEDYAQLIKIKQRGMANMKYFKGTHTSVLLGQHTVKTPIGMAGMPLQKTYHFEGEVASA